MKSTINKIRALINPNRRGGVSADELKEALELLETLDDQQNDITSCPYYINKPHTTAFVCAFAQAEERPLPCPCGSGLPASINRAACTACFADTGR